MSVCGENDPCLSCPLPDCDDNDPRCPLREPEQAAADRRRRYYLAHREELLARAIARRDESYADYLARHRDTSARYYQRHRDLILAKLSARRAKTRRPDG